MTMPKFKNDDTPENNTAAHHTGSGDSFDEPSRRGLPKALKWMAGTALALVILAGAGGFVATQFIDQQKYKALIVSKVEEATGYTVDWDGNISIGMMPLPHASISKLTVKAGDTQILSVAKADIQVALAPLLSRKVEIKDITIDEPVITLLTTKSGQQTWAPKAKADDAPSAEATAEDSANSGAAMDVVVNHIEMNGGALVIDNQQTGSRQELKNLNLKIRANSLKGPFDLTGDTEWSGQKIEIKATSGEVNASEGSYPIQTAVSVPASGIDLSFSGVVDSTNMGASGDINLEVDDVAKAVKGLTGTAASLPEGLGGKAALAGKLVYTSSRVAVDDMMFSLGALSYSGSVAANGLSGENEQPQLSFQLQPKSKAAANAPALVQLLSDLTIFAKGSVENEKAQIATATIKTMGNNISINGYSTIGANPAVDLTVNASEINLDAFSQTNGSAADSSSSHKAVSGKSSDMGFEMPFSGRVRADIAKLTTGGKVYSNIKADVSSNSGALTISNAELSLVPDTFVNASGKISDTSNLSGLNMKVVAKTQDTEKLFAALGVEMPELPKKIGGASLNGNFSGDLKNLGFSAVVSALQFNVKGEGSVGDPLGVPAISSLKFNINHPNFNDAMKTIQPGFAGSTGFFGPLDLSGELAWGTDKIDVTSISGKLGQTTVAGNIAAVTKPKPKISGALDFGAIVFPSATNNGGTVAATPAAATSVKGDRWSRDTIDTAWMKSFDADLSVKAKSITQNMWKLSDANLAFKLNDGTLTLDNVSAGLFGGRASINGTIKSGVGPKDPLSINAKLNAENVDAQDLMSAATGKVSYTLTGTLSKVDMAVNATGASVANLVQTLGGNGSMNGKNLIVKGVDAAQLATAAKGSYKPLDRAGSLFQSFQGGQTEFTDFNSDFTIQSGIVNFGKIYFDGPKATLNTTGNVNLPDWTVNLKNTMTVKDTDIPPFDFTIKGSLDNPANSGGDIINNYLQKKLEKKATKLLEDKLGGKLGELLGGGAAAKGATGSTTQDTAPATGEAATVPDDGGVSSAPAENDKQKAAKEAVKALQGLFGK